jgi:hypothetical protein
MTRSRRLKRLRFEHRGMMRHYREAWRAKDAELANLARDKLIAIEDEIARLKQHNSPSKCTNRHLAGAQEEQDG